MALHTHRASGIPPPRSKLALESPSSPQSPCRGTSPPASAPRQRFERAWLTPIPPPVPNRINTPINILSSAPQRPCPVPGQGLPPAPLCWVTEAPCSVDNGPKCITAGQGQEVGAAPGGGWDPEGLQHMRSGGGSPGALHPTLLLHHTAAPKLAWVFGCGVFLGVGGSTSKTTPPGTMSMGGGIL